MIAQQNGPLVTRAGFAEKFADELQVGNSTASGSDWDSQSISSEASDQYEQRVQYMPLETPCSPWMHTGPRGAFGACAQEIPAAEQTSPASSKQAFTTMQAPMQPQMMQPQMQQQQLHDRYAQEQMMQQMQQMAQQMQQMQQMKQMQQQWMNAMSSVVTIPVPVPVPMKMPQQPPVQVPFGYQLVRQEKPMLEDLLPGQTRSVRRRNARPKRAESQIGGSQSSKVFVGGLSPHSTAETLRAHFEKFGVITDCAVINEPGTRKSRGFGFVEFAGGIPAGLLEQEHIVGQRRCGVRAYEYSAQDGEVTDNAGA
jgi:hypothetical protein